MALTLKTLESRLNELVSENAKLHARVAALEARPAATVATNKPKWQRTATPPCEVCGSTKPHGINGCPDCFVCLVKEVGDSASAVAIIKARKSGTLPPATPRVVAPTQDGFVSEETVGTPPPEG